MDAELVDRCAASEATIERIVATLTEHGWRFADHLSSDACPIDQIAVGTGGVFIIDHVDWTGRISCDDSVLHQNGQPRELAVARCADAALHVASLLPAELVGHVHPVLCFLRDEQLNGWARDVSVCSTASLEQFLLSRPSVLPPERVAPVLAQLRSMLSVDDAAPSDPPSSVPAPDLPPYGVWPAGRGRAMLVRLVMLVAVCVAVIAAGVSISNRMPAPADNPSTVEPARP